jgi:hypothetical protein
MDEKSFHRDNHYVPRSYLKHWASSKDQLCVYRILVSNNNVPIWKRASVKGIAYHSHLYTQIIAGLESDDFEKWLDREFEAPAAEAIQKVVSGSHLTAIDWKRIIRFAAAQDVRTPARLVENLQRWNNKVPEMIDRMLHDTVNRLEKAHEHGETLKWEPKEENKYLPIRVTTKIEPGQKYGEIKAEVVLGRKFWLYSMNHVLTKTVTVLEQQKWTILTPPDGLKWFTSDDPVIRLNYYGSGKYDFKGGWGNPGTEILLPLSPNNLLYTMVGHSPKIHGKIPVGIALMMRQFIAEHADRFVFAFEPDPDVAKLRPRTVNGELLRYESEQWRMWHAEQSAAERE